MPQIRPFLLGYQWLNIYEHTTRGLYKSLLEKSKNCFYLDFFVYLGEEGKERRAHGYYLYVGGSFIFVVPPYTYIHTHLLKQHIVY